MKKLFYILLIFTFLTSCSEYQKALKSDDTAAKFKLGEELYNEGYYSKANTLFTQVVPIYKGKPQGERLMYLYSNNLHKKTLR